ncbi:hypothetical protein [Streptomyces sp. NPDC085937]|uniref:hypothetical protein n=1 Tax=Streptomyces sp. NPDC085937 TaxID=3365742 RepID=UPI0037D3F6CF
MTEGGAVVEHVGGWLRRDNLKGFLVALSEVIGYRFDGSDWGAVEAGLEVGAGGDGWFGYPLGDDAALEVAMSRVVEEGETEVRVVVAEGLACLREQVRVAWMIFNRFEVSPEVEMAD